MEAARSRFAHPDRDGSGPRAGDAVRGTLERSGADRSGGNTRLALYQGRPRRAVGTEGVVASRSGCVAALSNLRRELQAATPAPHAVQNRLSAPRAAPQLGQAPPR